MSRDRPCSFLLPINPRGLLRVTGLASLLACTPSAHAETQSSAMIRLEQIGFMCANGDSEVQFVELGAIASGQSFSSALALRVRDRFGTVTYERANLFAPKPDGAPWPQAQAWLIGTGACSLATAVSLDLGIGRVLDPYGGTT